MALALASAGVTGRFPAKPADLVIQGLKSFGASDEITELTDQLRGEVFQAAKAAALAAAVNGVNALSERLRGVAAAADVDEDEVVADVGGALDTVAAGVGDSVLYDDEGDEEEVGEAEEVDEEEVGEAEEVDEGEDADLAEEAEYEEPRRPPPRRRATRQPTEPRVSARGSTRAASAVQSPIRAARPRPATTRAPVRRGR
jgi:hypothetical protein